MIEVDSLSFYRGRRRILADLSFSIQSAEHLVIVGPNGAGKTTLLKCLNRILDSWTGLIRIEGREVRALSRRKLARLVGYVPQAHGISTPYEVREFVSMSRYAAGGVSESGKSDRVIVNQSLARTGVTALADRLMDSLSGGERQKVFLAAALAQETPILLLDEPTSFLDPRHSHEFSDVLRHLHLKEKRTLVTVSHDLNEAAMTADRVLALDAGGTIAFLGPAADFMNAEILKKVYGTDFLLIPHPETGRNIIVPKS